MIAIRNPEGSPAPATYHHGVEVSGAVRTLYIAGQIGTLADGGVPQGIAAQTEALYDNMRKVLAAARMSFDDVVKSTVFLVDPADRPAFNAARAAATGGHKHASTLVFIAGLVLPTLLVEVEAVAVKAVA